MAKQIYLLHHIHNQNWFYVGATKLRLSEVKRGKLFHGRRGTHKSPVYQAMRQDDNPKSWVATQLHDFTESWEQLEADFIRLFNSYERGLNATADGQRGRSLGAKAQLMGVKAAAAVNSKPVTNGTTCYASASEASRVTGITRSSIAACCRGKRKTAGNFKWEYAQ